MSQMLDRLVTHEFLPQGKQMTQGHQIQFSDRNQVQLEEYDLATLSYPPVVAIVTLLMA